MYFCLSNAVLVEIVMTMIFFYQLKVFMSLDIMNIFVTTFFSILLIHSIGFHFMAIKNHKCVANAFF